LFQLLIKHLQSTHARGAQLDMPIAICLTKMDQDEHWRYLKRPESYLQELLGAATFNLLDSIFPRKGFFGVSIVGRYKDPKTGEERSNLDTRPEHNHLIDRKNWKPENALDPLFWLLDQMERERDSRLPWWRRALRRAVREPNYKK
jgi:hypothetical protein